MLGYESPEELINGITNVRQQLSFTRRNEPPFDRIVKEGECLVECLSFIARTEK
jgi:hypothetical protein